MTPCRIHTRILPVPDELMLFLDTSFLFLPTSPPDPRVLSFSKKHLPRPALSPLLLLFGGGVG
jgi:hypothetical protein